MLELSYEELDSLVQQVCSGKKIAFVEDKSGTEIPLLFKYPSPCDTRLADLVYKKSIQTAKREGLPSIAEMEDMVKRRGIFTEEDEEKIEKLKSRIEGQRAVLAKTIRVPSRRDRLVGIISNLELEIGKIISKKETSLDLTQERKAAEEKYLYLTLKGVYSPFSGDAHWPTETEFNDEPDFLFRKRVFLAYIIFSHGLTQEYIRYLARSNLWRIRYVTALKIGESLFGAPISGYTVDQLTVLYWSHYYQSIYEMMPDERPSDNIIEDDEALDAYMKDWHADRNRDNIASRASKNKNYGNSSAWDHGETLVMRSNPMYQDVEYSETLAEKSANSKRGTVDAAAFGRNKKNK